MILLADIINTHGHYGHKKFYVQPVIYDWVTGKIKMHVTHSYDEC
mgnify:CR=1 FL=1